MSEGMGTAPDNGSGGRGQIGVWVRLILFLMLVAAIVYAGTATMRTFQARNAAQETEEKTVQSSGLITPTPKGLASGFTDSQGRLLADPETSPDKWIDPDVIVFAHIVGSDPENPATNWGQFQAYLAKMTGKKVVGEAYNNSADQLAEIGKGKITVLALHAADSPFLVNNYGFEPTAVLGSDSGANGNHLDIIVPAGSSMSRASDLKGHSLVCTVPTSITGYRAAVAMLMQAEGLRPNVDYFVTWSLGQKRSISGVAKNQYEAAAVSDDKLQSMLDNGDIQKTEYKLIYQSEVIPRTTIGWFYNLKPELAEKVRQAIVTFKPMSLAATTRPGEEAEASEDASSAPAALHFIPIDYKMDFQLVREIDDSFDPRLDGRAKGKASESATTMPSVSVQ